MKIRYFILVTLLLAIIILQLQCKILSFENKPLAVDVTIEQEFHVSTNKTSFNQTNTIDLAAQYQAAGVPTENIQEAIVKNIEILISDNKTSPNIKISSGMITMTKVGELDSYILANFPLNLVINDVLNQPIDPFTTAVTLGVSNDGITKLKEWLETSPPPVIRITMNLTLSGTPPVDFKAKVTLSLQVKYQA